MRILDPIHNYIIFSDGEARIVDSLVFQRLRYIRQLGFAEYAFPGAVHNRFLHSLGVYHLAGLFFDSLFQNYALPDPKKKQLRQVLCLAALLHDVGHGPLSHNSEKAMPLLSDLNLSFIETPEGGKQTNSHTLPLPAERARHEHYTLKFILESKLSVLIENLGVDPYSVAHLIDRAVPLRDKDFFICDGVNFQPLLKQIISSDIDVDRMDYLQRDSFFSGVDYGFCDHRWIVNNLHIYVEEDQAFLAIGEKALYSVENFLLSRRHISLAVYFHNKMVAMGEMLYRYFESEDCGFRIPPNLEDYTHCTDLSLFSHLKKEAGDNEWARRLTENDPYEKAYELRYFYRSRQEVKNRLQKIKDWLTAKGVSSVDVSSSSYVNYDIPNVCLKDVDWKRGQHDRPGVQRPPVYILNESTKKVTTLHQKVQAFNYPDHIQLLDRIYLSKKDCQKFVPIISKM